MAQKYSLRTSSDCVRDSAARSAAHAFPATGSPGASLPPSGSPLNWSSSFDFSFIAQCDSAGSAYLSTGRTLAPWSPSPCERLSLSPTTMRPPTLTTNILGLPDFAFRDEPPTFTGSDPARSLRQRLPIQPVPLSAVSRMEAGRFRVRRSSSFGLKIAACFSLGNL